jgi:hypothetical protein
MPVKRLYACGPITVLLFLLPACGDDGGGAARTDVPTFAYVLTECSAGPNQGYTHKQKLLLSRGDADPITVVEFPAIDERRRWTFLCKLWGQTNSGLGSVIYGAFQRIGMSSDGALLVFEVSDDHSVVSKRQVPTEQEGIFVVRTDGTGLRRIADASRSPCFRFQLYPPVSDVDAVFSWDGSSSQFTFSDTGPGPGGEAVQVFTMDAATGTPHQVTRLPPAEVEPGRLPVLFPGFLDAETIAFYSRANPVIGGEESNPTGERRLFTVKTHDPQTLQVVPSFAEPGSAGKIVETFQITGPDPVVRIMPVPGEPENGCGQNDCFIYEVFVLDSKQILQLTNLRRSDTAGPAFDAERRRVSFYASADPFGTNPFNNCQLFSIDRTGADLRQLTNFDEGEESLRGCNMGSSEPGCIISQSGLGPDPEMPFIRFASSCDPFGTNPNGLQLFSIRSDGTGLRQLTHTRGMRTAPDWTVTVELPGPYASPRTRW